MHTHMYITYTHAFIHPHVYYTYRFIYTLTCILHTHAYTCMCILYIHAYMCSCIIYMHMHLYTHMYIIYTHSLTYIYTPAFIHTCIITYIHTYIFTHMYIMYTQAFIHSHVYRYNIQKYINNMHALTQHKLYSSLRRTNLKNMTWLWKLWRTMRKGGLNRTPWESWNSVPFAWTLFTCDFSRTALRQNIF